MTLKKLIQVGTIVIWLVIHELSLVTKSVGDNFEMLVTNLAILVNFTHNIGHQHSQYITNILIVSPTSERYRHFMMSHLRKLRFSQFL